MRKRELKELVIRLILKNSIPFGKQGVYPLYKMVDSGSVYRLNPELTEVLSEWTSEEYKVVEKLLFEMSFVPWV